MALLAKPEQKPLEAPNASQGEGDGFLCVRQVADAILFFINNGAINVSLLPRVLRKHSSVAILYVVTGGQNGPSKLQNNLKPRWEISQK